MSRQFTKHSDFSVWKNLSATAFGAEVTAVDNTPKIDLLRSAGADHVIDYTQEDFTQGTERYDLVLDIPGNHPFSKIKRALTSSGLYVLIAHDGYGRTRGKRFGSLPRVFRLMARIPFDRQYPGQSSLRLARRKR
ncbi:MAG: zinc-binding dehydrogenase [Chloroflexi bacterium]|nr:zinc-binding dehydrogenase [Chloroflexota bacterium]